MRQQRVNQAPDYVEKYGSTDRVKLTCVQSLVKYHNPYGDQCNELLNNLNMAWKARRILFEISNLTNGTATEPFRQEIAEIDANITKAIAYLEEHKVARPYQFSVFTGYSYKDLGPKWEGRWSNK